MVQCFSEFQVDQNSWTLDYERRRTIHVSEETGMDWITVEDCTKVKETGCYPTDRCFLSYVSLQPEKLRFLAPSPTKNPWKQT